MIGYLTIGTNDLAKAGDFYDELFAAIGANRVMTDERMLGWGWSPEETMFSVLKPYDGAAATVGNGVMIALNVKTPAAVEALYEKALALGAARPPSEPSTSSFESTSSTLATSRWT